MRLVASSKPFLFLIAALAAFATSLKWRKNDNVTRERIELALKGSRDGLFDWDLTTDIVFYSDRCYEQIGYTRGELDLARPETLFSMIHADDVARVRSAVKAHIEEKTPYDVEFRVRCKSGAYSWLQSRGHAQWNAAGQAVRFAGFHRDINERIIAQERLRAGESRFSQMADTINEVFWTSDLRGRSPTYVSPAYETIFGRTVQSLFDNPGSFFEATHPEDRERLVAIIKLQRQVRYSCQIEYRIIKPDGSISWVWARLCALKAQDDKVIGLCGVTADITFKKNAEKRVSEFYSTISHELRTPLTSIRGSLGLIEGGIAGEVSPQVHKLVQIGRVETERLIRLVNDILDIRKIESGMFSLCTVSISADTILTAALEGISGMALESRMQLESIIATKAKIWGDSDRLIQVLNNLISNAIKYAFADTQITVRVSDGKPGMVRFEVRDRGPGIRQEDLSKLFVMFQQLDQSDIRSKGGTGLGLAISKGIVTEHGGTIGVDTEIGQGSTFWFEVPADVSKVATVQT